MNKSKITRYILVFCLVGSVLTFGGCINFGAGTTAPAKQVVSETQKMYENAEYSIIIPKTWEVIEKNDFTAEIPAETQVVFRNNVKNENFTANVNIVRNNLQEPISSLEYAKRVLNREKSGLYDYHESRQDEYKITMADKSDDTYFVVFEAKKAADEKVVRYFQTYIVRGNYAYIVTGTCSTMENDSTRKTLEDIVKSFRAK